MNNVIAIPLSVARQEFIDQLFNDVNNCGLPLFVVESILRDTLELVKNAAQKQYEAEKAQYEQQIKGSSNNSE